jgi:hypothetical protein
MTPSSDKTNPNPIDGDYGIAYQLFVLQRMIEQLPEQIAEHLMAQVQNVTKAIVERDNIIYKIVLDRLDDVRLEVTNMDFDLNATKQEKAALEKILRDAGLL